VEAAEAGESRIRFSYKLAQAGFYRLELTAGGTHLGESPFSLQVSASKSNVFYRLELGESPFSPQGSASKSNVF
jgi:hypothetical protein